MERGFIISAEAGGGVQHAGAFCLRIRCVLFTECALSV